MNFHSGNLVKVSSKTGHVSPFTGLCIRYSKERIKVLENISGIVKDFPLYEGTPFLVELLRDQRLRKARAYFLKEISSKKLRNKWINKK